MPGTMTYVGFDVHARSTHAAAIDSPSPRHVPLPHRWERPEAQHRCGGVGATSPEELSARAARGCCSCLIGAARDSAVGALRRRLATSIDAPRGLLLRSAR